MNELASTDESRNTLPPLRIHHLMIWMVAVAAVMSLYSEAFRATSFEFTPLVTFYFAGTNVLRAVAAATLALGIYWKIKGSSFFAEVGQWLLVINTFSLLINGLPYLFYVFFDNWTQSPGWMYLLQLISLLRLLLFGVLFIVASRRVANTATWKRFCKHVGVMCLLGALLQTIGLLVSLIPYVGNIGWSIPWQFSPVLQTFVIPIYWGILCALSVREDLMSGWRRHWSHWCGVITWLAATLVQWVSNVFSYISHAL